MKYRSTFGLALMLAVALVTLSACDEEVRNPKEGAITFLVGGNAPAAGTPMPKTANESHASLPAESMPLIEAGNAFSLKLFGALLENRASSANLVLSPISIETALGMNAIGLSDEAFDEYRSALKLPATQSLASVARYYQQLNAVMCSAGEYACYFPSNSFWVSSKYQSHLIKSYPQQLFDFFGASTATLDLSDPASYEAVNAWISRETYGKIPRMLEPSHAVEQDPLAFLVNTAFFAAAWQWKTSEERTKAGHFTNGAGEEEPAMMMSIYNDSSIDYFADDRFEALSVGLLASEEMREHGETPFRMLLILPKDRTLPLSQSLPTTEELRRFTTAGKRYALDIRLPRLNAGIPTLDLTPELMKLGLCKTLGVPLTELSRMFDPKFLAQQMSEQSGRQSRLYHQATLQWNEKGVEGAAATVIGVVEPGVGDPLEPRSIAFDRPFFASIVHPDTGKILFIAAINTLRR